MNNKKVIDLIFKADEMTLEEFASHACEKLGSINEILYVEDLIEDEIMEGHKNRSSLIKALSELCEKGVLPTLKGHYKLDDFVYEPEMNWEDYIGPHDEGDGHYAIWNYKDEAVKEIEEFDVDIKGIHIIVPLQESEMIIASNDVPEHFYVQYHDDPCPFLISNGNEAFIKAIISLSLIDNDELFNLLLDGFENEKVEDKSITTSIKTLFNLLSNSCDMIFKMNLTEDTEERYWEVLR